jgi:ABC-type nitrate/sulfonate/bicarbonate transport system ATPase subunit
MPATRISGPVCASCTPNDGNAALGLELIRQSTWVELVGMPLRTHILSTLTEPTVLLLDEPYQGFDRGA